MGVGAALLGCGQQDVCVEGCPRVGGTYQLTQVVPAQECGFEPYLFPPVLELAQSPDGTGVDTQLIDPVNQLQVPISGEVLEEEDSRVGGFRMRARVTRQRSGEDTSLVNLDVRLTGSVDRGENPARLGATLQLFELFPRGSTGCVALLQVTGEEVILTPTSRASGGP